MHPVILAKITNPDYAFMPIKSLEQILQEGEAMRDADSDQPKLFKARFNI